MLDDPDDARFVAETLAAWATRYLPSPEDADEAAFAKAIDGMAERLEAVAERLENI